MASNNMMDWYRQAGLYGKGPSNIATSTAKYPVQRSSESFMDVGNNKGVSTYPFPISDISGPIDFTNKNPVPKLNPINVTAPRIRIPPANVTAGGTMPNNVPYPSQPYDGNLENSTSLLAPSGVGGNSLWPAASPTFNAALSGMSGAWNQGDLTAYDQNQLAADNSYFSGTNGVASAVTPALGGGLWDSLKSFMGGAIGTKENPGWGGMAIGAANSLMGGYLGMKQYGLAKDSFAESKRQFQANFDAQKQTTNADLEDRQKARLASNSGAYESLDSYMKKNRIN